MPGLHIIECTLYKVWLTNETASDDPLPTLLVAVTHNCQVCTKSMLWAVGDEHLLCNQLSQLRLVRKNMIVMVMLMALVMVMVMVMVTLLTQCC